MANDPIDEFAAKPRDVDKAHGRFGTPRVDPGVANASDAVKSLVVDSAADPKLEDGVACLCCGQGGMVSFFDEGRRMEKVGVES